MAQQITIEQIPAKDMLQYVGINPTDVSSVKFSVAFPSKKYAALEWRETEGAKVVASNRKVLWLEPCRVYGVEVVVLPYDRSRTVRMVGFKFSSEAGSISGSMPVFFPNFATPNQCEIGPVIPTVLKYTVGAKTYTISVLTSDLPMVSN